MQVDKMPLISAWFLDSFGYASGPGIENINKVIDGFCHQKNTFLYDNNNADVLMGALSSKRNLDHPKNGNIFFRLLYIFAYLIYFQWYGEFICV